MNPKAQEILAKIAEHKENVEVIQAVWAEQIDETEFPDNRQCLIWLKRHSLDIIIEAIECMPERLSIWDANSELCPEPKTHADLCSYVSGIMSHIADPDSWSAKRIAKVKAAIEAGAPIHPRAVKEEVTKADFTLDEDDEPVGKPVGSVFDMEEEA